MQRNPASRPPATSGVPAPVTIDVDKFYMKYEYNSEDDGIETIDARTFREGVRRERERKRLSTSVAPPAASASKSVSSSAQPTASSSRASSSGTGRLVVEQLHPVAHARRAPRMPDPAVRDIFRHHLPNPPAHMNAIAGPSQPRISAPTLPPISPPPRRIPAVDHPSQIGDAITLLRQQKQQQKRPIASTPQPVESSTPQKRRRLNIPPTPIPLQSTSTHVMVNIPIGPPGRRSTLSTMVTTDDMSKAPRPRTVDKGKGKLSPSIPPPALLPPASLPTVQNQGNKRVFSEVIELSSDEEEIQKLLTPHKKKQKHKQTSKTSVIRSLSPIEIDSSDPEGKGGDVIVQPVPQSTVDVGSKYEGEVGHDLLHHLPESIVQGLPELAPAPAPESEANYDDSDEESDWDPFGDIYDSTRWNSSTYHLEDEEDETDRLDIARLNISDTVPPKTPPRSIHPNTSKWTARPPRKSVASPVEFIWDKLRAAGNVHVRPRVRTQRALTMPSYVRPWNLDFDLHTVKLEHSFKKAPGSINRIEQSGPWMAIASASFGGLPDAANDERALTHNRPGSLLTWGAGGLDMPSGHTKLAQATRTPVKYYAVHDVKFDPLSTTIVSSGADCKVRLWNLEDEVVAEAMGDDGRGAGGSDSLTPSPEPKSKWRNGDWENYKCVPHDIAFNPGSSIMAVAEKRCHIYEIIDAGPGHGKQIQKYHNFLLHASSKAPHIVGSMVWGTGPTKDRLFVSSEPDLGRVAVDEARFQGVHKVYDLEKKTFVCNLSASEAGDTMAVDSTGGTLALSTRGAINTHILRLYDVKRMRSRPSSAVQLPIFPQRHEEFEGEVNSAAFSPDSIYLALARSDNHLHVYDVRMLVRGPVLDYMHGSEKESRVPGVTCGVYGVVKAQWVWSEATRRTALVSGGEDGCVRLWNPLLAGENKENGVCVARMNSDVAHFSIGDHWTGEHRLVVGDSAGEVMIFNNIIF